MTDDNQTPREREPIVETLIAALKKIAALDKHSGSSLRARAASEIARTALDAFAAQAVAERAPPSDMQTCCRDSRLLIYPESCDECRAADKCLARLPLQTCPKCGATGAAFVCSTPGCPVNGGAYYG